MLKGKTLLGLYYGLYAFFSKIHIITKDTLRFIPPLHISNTAFAAKKVESSSQIGMVYVSGRFAQVCAPCKAHFPAKKPSQEIDSMGHLQDIDHQKMLDQLIRHEGLGPGSTHSCHVPYRCTAGALTIGYGHNLDACPIPGVTAASSINGQQALDILNQDVQKVENALAVSLPWCLQLSAPRYAVLVNMGFNLGVAGLLKFVNTLSLVQKALSDNNYQPAAHAMLRGNRWHKQVGKRAQELAEQMKYGIWQAR